MMGVSDRAMIAALIASERDPRVLADLAKGRLRVKHTALIEALTGRFDEHHAELAAILLDPGRQPQRADRTPRYPHRADDRRHPRRPGTRRHLSLIHISGAHETPEHLVCRLLLEKKKKKPPPTRSTNLSHHLSMKQTVPIREHP